MTDSALIAEDLLRVMLHDGRGSLPRHGLRERKGAARRLDVSLRAALFCDLARAGRLSGTTGPVPSGATAGDAVDSTGGPARDGLTQERILAAVLTAVHGRPGLAWPRWFRHIREDRRALIDGLVASGRWQARGGVRCVDADPAGAQRLQARTYTVGELIEAPSGDRETILAYLYTLAGPKMASERVLGWDVRLSTLNAASGGPTLRMILAAARATGRPSRLRGR